MTIKGTASRMALALAGATALTASAAFAQEDGKTFALVQINQQALFFNEMNRGAEQAAEELGAELVIFNANNEAFQQNSAIETYITQGVDGIAVVAIDVNGIMPAVEQADAAGIPVVAIDAILPDGPQAAQIGVDNAQAGADLAAHIGETMDGGEMSLGVVGALNSYIQNVRRDGFVENLPDGVTVVNTVDGQNIQDVALNASENLLTANPGMNAIYGTGEPALMGAIAAVTSQGRTGDVSIYGWDLTEQAIAGIDEGYVEAVIQQDPAEMGAAAIRALATLADGGEVEAEISVPVTIVTQDNVDEFRSLFE
ncbi:substrate-binding domain-containing protein [Palleronia sp. LCG004]|uniref:substrate-binding domain-containing protein n=1 Tax=Palleronia sp. LCG004 TaxID=3079304 RepID=UPI002941D57C|nr:substrate-binding domain-containing protein [Palleronia sp. LCG004]WOI57789.1 substrate-binding domain-containing protein [Palleronia sp. LCG004]